MSNIVEFFANDGIGDDEDEDVDKTVDESSVSVSSSISQWSLLFICEFCVNFLFEILGVETFD